MVKENCPTDCDGDACKYTDWCEKDEKKTKKKGKK